MNLLKAVARRPRKFKKPKARRNRGLVAELRAHANGLRQLELDEGRPALVERAADKLAECLRVLRLCRVPMDMLAVSETAMPEVQTAHEALKKALRR